MSIAGVTSALAAYESSKTKNSAKNTESASASSATSSSKTTTDDSQETKAAVYEKGSTEDNIVYQKDTATITRLKADAERRSEQLRELVKKMFEQQGLTFDDSNMYNLLREGKVPVDAETSAQAQKDIAEDGYWGVTQTSDRLVSFAKALSGGDPSKADELISAIKEGFKQATEAWGDDLPDICQNTLDETLKKLDEWKKSVSTDTTDTADTTDTTES